MKFDRGDGGAFGNELVHILESDHGASPDGFVRHTSEHMLPAAIAEQASRAFIKRVVLRGG